MRLSTRVVVLSLLAAGMAPLRAQIIAPSDLPVVAPDSAVVVRDSAQQWNDLGAKQAAPQMAAAQPAARGAPMTGLRAGVYVREASRPDQPNILAPEHANLGQARAMMVVGVAALIAGAIIGDTPGTIVMVGGAVIGLVGLYDYLQ